MAVYERGDGPPIVLLHGFPFDHRIWEQQFDELSERGWLIAPDLRGFGQTTVTPGKVTMEQMADDVAGLLDALDVQEPIHLCGLSMGGYVAWQFWRKYPERLRTLIQCDTRAAADAPEAAQSRLKMAEHVLQHGTKAVAEAMLPTLFAGETLAREPEPVETARRLILAANPEGVAAAQRGMAERPDMTGELGRIDLPVLLIVGEKDQISPPREMRAIADALPQGEIVVVPYAGHLAPLERFQEVNPTIRRFLWEQKETRGD